MSQQSECLKQLYSLITQYVRVRGIELPQFWSSDRLCVQFDTFKQMLSVIGFRIKSELALKLQKQEIDIISLQNVLEGVQYWKQQEGTIYAYMSKTSNKNMKIVNKQIPSKLQRSQIQADMLITQKNKSFLDQHARKQIQGRIKLSTTLRNVKNQSNYELSMKIGEANDICTKLKNGTSYTIQTNKQAKITILCTTKGKAQQKISQKKFEQQYQNLRTKIMNQANQIEGNLDEDLKKILVEVMCLSSQMKQQIKLLQSKGISH